MRNTLLALRQSQAYARKGVGFAGAVLKHSLVPLSLLQKVLPERGLILDLGCGEGMLANLVATSRGALSIHGVDRDVEKVALANKNAPPNACFEATDILEQSFHGAAVSIFNDVLHHHPFRMQGDLLAKAASFLDEYGILIIKEVDARDCFDRAWTSFWDTRLYPGDILYFRDIQQWREVLFDTGFQLVRVHRLRHPWPAARTVLICRRRRRDSMATSRVSLSDHMFSKPARVFVTGATGFIGRHLVRRLHEEGLGGRAVDLTILVRDRTSIPSELDGVGQVLTGDLELLPRMCEELADVEYVFHLAADKDFFGGKRVYANNVKGTQALLRALEGVRNLKRLVFASSVGAVDRIPADECLQPICEDSPAHPTSPYGQAKLDCERLISASPIPFTILRLPWCYGPGMTSKTHVRALMESVMRGSIAVRFAWPGRVSLLDVEECARAFTWVATNSKTQGQSFFVSDGEPIALRDLFREMGRTVGRNAGSISIPKLFLRIAGTVRSVLPLAVRSLFLDVLWVDDRKLRELGFDAAARRDNFLLPLARYVSEERRPSIHRSKVLVTGAASGIGYALSVQLAGRGRGVIMVDRNPHIEEIAGTIPGAEPCWADLSEDTELTRVKNHLESDAINWVINCAGIGLRGNVGSLDPSMVSKVIIVNVHALTQLTDAALRNFRRAREGVLVNVGSSAGFQPLPGMATYGATKAYVLSFSEAVTAEQSHPGIVVLTVCPSGTATNFQTCAGVRRVSGERLLAPEDVAAKILRACEKYRSQTVFIGARAVQMSFLARVLPRSMSVRLWKGFMDRYR